jgi:hypothetical protein
MLCIGPRNLFVACKSRTAEPCSPPRRAGIFMPGRAVVAPASRRHAAVAYALLFHYHEAFHQEQRQ